MQTEVPLCYENQLCQDIDSNFFEDIPSVSDSFVNDDLIEDSQNNNDINKEPIILNGKVFNYQDVKKCSPDNSARCMECDITTFIFNK